MDLIDEILHELEDDRTSSTTGIHSARLQPAYARGQQITPWTGEASLLDTSLDEFDQQLMAEPAPIGNPMFMEHQPFFQNNVDLRYDPNPASVGPRRLFNQPPHAIKTTSSMSGSLSTPPPLSLSQFKYNPTREYGYCQDRIPVTPTKSPSQRRKNSQIPNKTRFDPTKRSPGVVLSSHKRATTQPRLRQPIQGQETTQSAIALAHAPPIVQGISLVQVTRLPDRLRQIFSFELFNAIQSKIFEAVYESSDNVVVSAPTGSGKTTIMELAICRLVGSAEPGSYKVIYQAPTKALCAEKKRDWDKKFSSLGLVCTELTGDTDFHQISHVKNGDIIITTPEKWDSMTRRWQDHKRLLQMVKLFLIDEIHMLKESRGATLEVVITRMKSIGADVRFIALSATVPNSQDIAEWLGKNCAYPNTPAYEARFDEDFRPVKLQKFVYGYNGTANDFMFDKSLDKMLPDVIKKHSGRKPIMVFCMTRQICQNTAKILAEHWSKGEQMWPAPGQGFSFRDRDLQNTALCGVAFHHAGLDQNDRILVEKMFLEGSLFVICCTSTLAVGINMPAYLVILKNTCTFSDGRPKEYDDLEVMQMIGRAGRPQFDTSGVAVIMTKNEHKEKYERMIAGTELVESCLHANLVEHLNAEIGMGTITDVSSAKLWLKSTFLWVRMKRNPSYYKIEGQTIIMDIEQKLEEICEKDVTHLQEAGMVYQNQDGKLKCTPAGTAMATYYLKFETVKGFLALGYGSKTADILQTISEAQEFKELRMRVNERPVFREINKGLGMRYPLKGDVSTTAHKANILIQFELGAMEYPVGDTFQKYNNSLTQDKKFVFQHVHRLIRCLIDCLNETKDAIALQSALGLARCFSARCWENSPNQLRQLDGIGLVTVKKLAMANIRTLADLGMTDPHKIEMVASRNPPFGSNILKEIGQIPVFSLNVTQVSKTANKKDPIKVACNANIGYTNKGVLNKFKGGIIIVYFLAECDGHLIDFRRISVNKLHGGRDVPFTAEVSNSKQKITCYVSCESIVGTLKSMDLYPEIDPSLFPPAKPKLPKEEKKSEQTGPRRLMSHFTPASCLFKNNPVTICATNNPSQDLDEYDDGKFVAAVKDLDFSYFDNLEKMFDEETEANTRLNAKASKTSRSQSFMDDNEALEELTQLPNGNWACKHKCGDKTRCKHMCCRVGLEKPPKPSKKKPSAAQEGKRPSLTVIQTEIQIPARDAAADYVPKFSQMNRKGRPGSSELANRLRKGGLDVVDLVNEELQQDSGQDNDAEKYSKIKAKQPRVSIANGQPRYLYESRTQPDISTLISSNKVSAIDTGFSYPEGITTSTCQEKVPNPTLFGSTVFDDDDLDIAFANMTEPLIDLTNLPNAQVNKAIDDHTHEFDISIPSSPPFQTIQNPRPITRKRKSIPCLIRSSEETRTKDKPSDDSTGVEEIDIPVRDKLQKSEEGATALPGKSLKRFRSSTPNSPYLNHSTRLKGDYGDTQHTHTDKTGSTTVTELEVQVPAKNIDQDLLDFLGDCVDFI